MLAAAVVSGVVSVLLSGPVALPPAGADLDYQLGGAVEPAANVAIVARDRTESPAAGRYNICYVNAFQTQPDARRFWRRHPGLVLRHDGEIVVDEAWGEWLLDIRTGAKRERLGRIVGRWIRGCARDGFDAVEFDNLDSWSRSDGLIRSRAAKRFARTLVGIAHEAGLAAGQKNWAEWDGTRAGFDLAIAEECRRWHECGRYVASYGEQVYEIEYRAKDFAAACADHGDRISIVLRDRALSPGGVRRWCDQPAG